MGNFLLRIGVVKVQPRLMTSVTHTVAVDDGDLRNSQKGYGKLIEGLAGGFKHFLCSSLFGEMIQFDEHIFQMG